jgi:hypothetical protein
MNWDDLKFKAKDYPCGCEPTYNCDEIRGKSTHCYGERNTRAIISNRILEEKLKRAPEVFLCNDPKWGGRKAWQLIEHAQDSHKARLVCVEETKK